MTIKVVEGMLAGQKKEALTAFDFRINLCSLTLKLKLSSNNGMPMSYTG